MLTRLLRHLFGRKPQETHELDPEELKFLSAVEQAPYHPFAEFPEENTAPSRVSETVRTFEAPRLPEPPRTPEPPRPAPAAAPALPPVEPADPASAFVVFRDPLVDDDSEGPAMVWLPAGRFLMGENERASADEKPAHDVGVDAFAIGQYPVTFAEYDCFCAATGREKPDDRGWGRDERPVINLSWRDAVHYCEWLSARTGQPYRLCTEAEWEYACRAGSTGRYSFGNDPQALGDYAWYRDNSGGTTQPVGQKRPNLWQLYDMHGNVLEWVADWLGPYGAEAQYNPTGPARGAARVMRGGSWECGADACRAAFRDSSHPALHIRVPGFRLARGGSPPGTEIPVTVPPFADFEVFRDLPEAPELVYLPGGNFFMGSDTDSGAARERPLHLVSLDGFALGRYPVTVEEYLRFVADTGQHAPDWMDEDSTFHLDNGSDDHYQRVAVDPEQGRHPVVGVSHEDAMAYCRWLSVQTGEDYQLPTEAQWEYACRAGTDTAYHFGDELESLMDYGWYDDNAELALQEVGQKLANPWGLYDMHGLVWEWVADWFGDYAPDPVENPTGPLVGSHRVMRGGSWNDSAGLCRSAFRARQVPGYRVSHLGFRVLRRV